MPGYCGKGAECLDGSQVRRYPSAETAVSRRRTATCGGRAR